MLKHLTLASILAGISITADADTFQFQFSGSGATATGSFTTSDTAAGTLAGTFNANFANVSALNLTVAGASSGNGTFALSDFNNMFFRSNGALNFTQNLVGQADFADFNLLGTGSPAPRGTNFFVLRSDDGSGTSMNLACFFLQGVGTCGTPVSAAFAPISNFRTQGAAQTLDSLNGGSGEMANLLTTLSAMTPAQQAAVLERLAPGTNRAVQLSLRNNLLMSFDRLSARMDAMRYAPSSGGGSGDGDLANGLWFKPFGGGLRQDSAAGFSGYDGSNWGLSGGYDYTFNTATTAGLAFAYTNTNIGYNDQQSGDSNKIDSYEISAYGTHNLGVAYLEAMASWSRQTYATQRNTFLNGIANGSFDGDLWGARIGAGLPLAVYTATTLTPIVRLDWNHISQNAYTETDAGALNLDVAAASTNRLRSSLGAQLNHDTKLLGFAVQPFLRAFWHYDFMNSGVSASSSFAGGGAAFITPGQELDRYTGTVGAGMNVFTHNNFTGSVAYDYNVGSAYQSHTAQAQIRWNF